MAPPRYQEADVAPGTETPPIGTAPAAPPRATVVAILSRQGAEGVASLQRLSMVDVRNPLPTPERAVQVAAQQTAEAAASATAAAATEVARSVEATVAAHATATAVAAQATAASTASATAAASPPATPAAATPVASVLRATPVVSAAMAAVTPPRRGEPPGWGQISPLPLALVPLFSALLGAVIWRRRREPFVIKAKPVRA